MKRAKLIVIEGTDGSGKETQSKKLEEYYSNKGLKVKRYSFPIYDSSTGKIVGGPYLGKPAISESYFEETSALVDPLVSSLYYAADRRYNFLKDIEKEIYKNDIVILDRYTTSNMGHQAGKAKNAKQREQILRFLEILEYDLCELPKPDIVVFLHMPFEASLELRKSREAGDGNENNPKHLKDAEKTYVSICKKYKWHNINCIKGKYNGIESIKSIDDISLEVINAVNNILSNSTCELQKMTRF